MRTLIRQLTGIILCATYWFAMPAAAVSSQDPAAVCDSVAWEASRQTGVPISVLKAITRTETGRRRDGAFSPWPWTVNMEGEGVWFDTPDDARAFVYDAFKNGARSFDVGCFQINYRWHHQHFSSLDEMFDPLANGLYAARFLSELFAETGDWTKAAGAFHSRTPELAEKYAARFNAFRQHFAAEDGTGADTPGQPFPLAQSEGSDIPEIPDIVAAAEGRPSAATPRTNSYPLLRTGSAGALGSLVPTTLAAGGSLFGGSAPDGGDFD